VNKQNDENEIVHELSLKFKKVLDLKNVECTACSKVISKTNWSKHEKSGKHRERLRVESC
jgi:hypothetical protein